MIEVLEAPADPIVSLAEMKAHLRVDHTDDDTLIVAYTAAAENRVDGPTSITGRCFRVWRLRLNLPGFGVRMHLPFPPLVSVDAVRYLDNNGDEQEFAEADHWRVIGERHAQGGLIALLDGAEWPSLLATADPDLVRIDFTAGYVNLNSPDASPLPKEIAQAVKLMVGDWYDHRASSVIAATVAPTPLGAEMLLAPFRTAGAYMAV
jgi:uncharacterized phiE125 gp8 family phage protein